jgi:hypothetical protein
MDVTDQVTIRDQIIEVQRELGIRKSVYTRMVLNNQMSKARAAVRMTKMEAVLRTLEAVRDRGLGSSFPPPATAWDYVGGRGVDAK